MNLRASDYKRLLSDRCQSINNHINYYSDAPAPVGYGGPPVASPIPDFAEIRQVIREMTEIVNEYEETTTPA